MSVSKTAFLILAHEYPQQLARLAGRLEAPWSDIFVHINRKVDIAPFRKASADRKITFLPDEMRQSVHWSGFSLLQAMLTLASYALQHSEANRFCFLSIADYPIKPLSHIQAALDNEREFLRVDRELDPSAAGLHNSFIRYRHLSDLPLMNQRSTPFPLFERAARGLMFHFPRRAPNGVKFYHGSCWAALTRGAMEEVFAFTAKRPELLDWLRYSRCPEEILFHSALKASDFQELISDDRTLNGKEDMPALYACHHIDWQHPNPDLPATLTMEQLPELQQSPALFARKMHPVISAELMDALDAML